MDRIRPRLLEPTDQVEPAAVGKAEIADKHNDVRTGSARPAHR
jgi:hypothetical protein